MTAPYESGAGPARRVAPRRVAVVVAVVLACITSATPIEAQEAAPPSPNGVVSRQALERVVADYVGLYTRPTLDRWKALFHPSLVVAYPTDDGSVRARGLTEFFKAQKNYFATGRKISERLENVRIDEGRGIASVAADFVFADEGKESRGKLGLHLVETKQGWTITAIVFSYDDEG